MTQPSAPSALALRPDLEPARAPETEPPARDDLGAGLPARRVACTIRLVDPEVAAMAERSTVDVHAPLERIRGKVAAALFGGLPALPERIGRFTIDRELGAGGMGIVYAAQDPQLDRAIAVKVLRHQSDPHGNARLLREAQAMARLRHRNVLTVYEASEHDGQIYVAMEYALGGTLAEWIDAGPRPWREVLAVLIPAGRGLAAAHQAGLVHRDFKPANVLLDGEGNALVSDFGLARAGGDLEALPGDLEETHGGVGDSERLLQVVLTRTGALVGTPAYMSPEQFAGAPATPRSDQFAFCVVLHEALYGRRPFAGHNVPELIAAIDRGEVRTPTHAHRVPRAVRAALLRGLSREPSRRFPSMDALLAELDGALRSGGWHSSGRARVMALSAAFAGLGALILLGGPPAGAPTAPAVPAPPIPAVHVEVERALVDARGAVEDASLVAALVGVGLDGAEVACIEGERACVVGRGLVRRSIADPSVLLGSAKILPAIHDGEHQGYKLYGVRNDTTLSRLRFKNGDLIVALDGARLTDPAVALAALAGLDAREQLVVDFERKGEAMQRTIVIAPQLPIPPGRPGSASAPVVAPAPPGSPSWTPVVAGDAPAAAPTAPAIPRGGVPTPEGEAPSSASLPALPSGWAAPTPPSGAPPRGSSKYAPTPTPTAPTPTPTAPTPTPTAPTPIAPTPTPPAGAPAIPSQAIAPTAPGTPAPTDANLAPAPR